ncbi:hypothetical protein [Desertibacillus haloalkaliphilus]|uniref:hypothetical protein n=1 Tax=Desertibacillus haloalkaliphilus TaxID=1328930 RepID=UPI001C26AE80|nr:hypothetical protein [Desertibacillus haloalkaliphilus]MBU8908190.1 hypothetical protein [Desertibacillus haloalkaliphilus]
MANEESENASIRYHISHDSCTHFLKESRFVDTENRLFEFIELTCISELEVDETYFNRRTNNIVSVLRIDSVEYSDRFSAEDRWSILTFARIKNLDAETFDHYVYFERKPI